MHCVTSQNTRARFTYGPGHLGPPFVDFEESLTRLTSSKKCLLVWTLPTGDDLPGFSGFEDIGTERMDGSFTATPTGVDSGDISGQFFLCTIYICCM